jgi:ATP-dependent RNA helicase DDX23/PRP28
LRPLCTLPPNAPTARRIGRTGRAGRKGTAITFLTGHDSEVFYDLKRLLEESKAAVPPELARSEAAKQKPGAISQKRDQIQYAKK